MKGNARILVINNLKEAAEHITLIGAEEGKVDWLASKSDFLTIKFDSVSVTDAIIIKNDMLEMGGNAAYNKGVYDNSINRSDVIVAGSRRELERLVKRLRVRTRNTSEIAGTLEFLLRADGLKSTSILCRGKRIPIGHKTVVMGVLEITPNHDIEKSFIQAEEIIEEGADIIDITCSPAMDKEKSLICSSSIIRKIRRKYSIPICTAVSQSEQAKRLLEEGADIINDVWAMQKDPGLAKTVAAYKAGVVLMHNSIYGMDDDIIGQIMSMLRNSISICQDAGVGINSIIADPGLGFGKTIEQNLKIVRKLREIKSLGVPLMVGPTGKNLYSSIILPEMSEKIETVISVVAISIANGTDIIRVHDVKQMKNAAKITDAIINK